MAPGIPAGTSTEFGIPLICPADALLPAPSAGFTSAKLVAVLDGAVVVETVVDATYVPDVLAVDLAYMALKKKRLEFSGSRAIPL